MCIGRITSAAVAAVFLAGCSTGGGADSVAGLPKADLVAQFTEADNPRVPTRDDLLGSWEVIQPAAPPDGQASRFADIEFGDTEHQAEVDKENFESEVDAAVTIAIDLGECPVKGVRAALVSDDGRLQVQYKEDLPITMELCVADEDLFLGLASADGTDDYIAIDARGNLWIKGDKGVFKFQASKATGAKQQG